MSSFVKLSMFSCFVIALVLLNIEFSFSQIQNQLIKRNQAVENTSQLRKKVIRHSLLDHGLVGQNMKAPLLYHSFKVNKKRKQENQEEENKTVHNLIDDNQAESPIIIDVGAYDGSDYALEGAKRGMIVFSFEPSTENIKKWRENLKDYKDSIMNIDISPEGIIHQGGARIPQRGPQLYLFNSAVSDYRGSIQFYDSVGPMNSVVNQDFHGYKQGKQVSVPVVRIDDIISPDTKVFLLKTDTQGNELGVLRGAKELLSNGSVQYLQLEFWPAAIRSAGEDPVELLNFIYNIGMDCYEVFSKRNGWASRFDSNTAGFQEYVDWLEEIKPDKSKELALGGWSELVCWA